MILLQKNKYQILQKVLIAVLLFLLYFFLMYLFRYKESFTDEPNNLLGGMVVGDGGIIYRDFYSQHTPVMYYLCGLFRLLGAASMVQYRLCFYGVLCMLWVFMYFRYQKYFGKWAMFLYPLLYIFSLEAIEPHGVAATVLADHLQAQCAVLLFLELLLYFRNKKIPISNSIIVSAAIFVGLGSAFMTAFVILVFVVSVIAIEVLDVIKAKTGLKQFFVRFFSKFKFTILIILLPFFGFLLFSLATGTLQAAYDQAVRLNTEVYSQYIGGMGSDFHASFLNVFPDYFNALVSIISNFFDGVSHKAFLLLGYLIFAVFIVHMGRKRISYGIIVFFFGIYSAMRGWAGFHSQPYWAVISIMLALLIRSLAIEPLFNKRDPSQKKRGIVCGIAAILAVAIFFYPFVSLFSFWRPAKADFRPPVLAEDSTPYYVDRLLEKDEMFATTMIDPQIFIDTNRIPATRMDSLVPWFAEWYEQEYIDDLNRNRPRVILHNPAFDIWGHPYTEFVPNVCAYIEENYISLGLKDQNIWVRNDFYDEAQKRLSSLNQKGAVSE